MIEWCTMDETDGSRSRKSPYPRTKDDRPTSVVQRIRSKPSFWAALILGVSLAGSSAYVAFLYNPEMRTQVRFDWEQAPASTASLSLTVRSEGPLTHGNHISIVSASFLIVAPEPLGPILFVVWIKGDPEAGVIRFTLPSVTETSDDPANSSTSYFASHDAQVSQEGGIILPADGDVVLKVHLSLAFENGAWQGWSDIAGPSLIPDEGRIRAAPISDYYTFLGLRVTAASMLVAASVAVAPAMEAYRALFSERRKGD